MCPKDLAYSVYLSGEKSLLDNLEMFRKIGDSFYICEMLLFLTQTSRWNGELVKARTYIEENLRLNRESGDKNSEESGLWELGMLEFLEGNLRQAREDFQTSQACSAEAGSEEIYPFLDRFFAWIALVQGDNRVAIQYSQAQLAAGSRHFIPWVISDALGFLGWEALTSGEPEQAVQYCEQALKMTGRVDNNLLSVAHYVLARVAVSRGEVTRAREFLKEFVTKNYYSWPPVQLGIQIFGILAVMQIGEKPELARKAAKLFGAQGTIQGCLLNVIPLSERKAFKQAISTLRNYLSEKDFSTAYAEGQAMTMAEAIKFALDDN